MRRFLTMWAAIIAVTLTLLGCSTATSAVQPSQAAVATPQWDGTFGARPVNPACHGSLDDPHPGDVICLSDMDKPLQITVGGTPTAPVTYSGNGSTPHRVQDPDMPASPVPVAHDRHAHTTCLHHRQTRA